MTKLGSAIDAVWAGPEMALRRLAAGGDQNLFMDRTASPTIERSRRAHSRSPSVGARRARAQL